jgi:hypothetical protein
MFLGNRKKQFRIVRLMDDTVGLPLNMNFTCCQTIRYVLHKT